MTSCAGKCYIRPRKKYYCIRLSRPLLDQRPHSDLVETLLHEMIHAYLAVTKASDDDSHGVMFHEHMHRINEAVGTKISVYHTFHEEVSALKRHWWRCDGPCRRRRPFFGWVKRATNRAPGPWDYWWRRHSYNCGGCFEKVKEPADYTRKRLRGLFGYGAISPNLTVSAPFVTPMTSIRTNKMNNTPASTFVPKYQKNTINYPFECPICMKKVFNFVLSDHLKVCGDLQRLFEQDGNVIGENDCNGERKNQLDISTCPLCNKALFEECVKTHLQECGRLQGIFDGDDSSRMDVTCPLCNSEVKGDLSSHISGCLTDDIFSTCDEGTFEKGTDRLKGNSKCLVCGKLISNMSLQDHLEMCESLQGMFEDEYIGISKHKSDGDDRDVQCCPFCYLEVSVSSHHFCECLNIRDESDEIYTAFDAPNETSINSSITIPGGVIDEWDRKVAYNLATLDDKSRPARNHDIRDGLNDYNYYKENDVRVNGPSSICSTGSITNQNESKGDYEPLIFCRLCGKFYSVSYCPVCCKGT